MRRYIYIEIGQPGDGPHALVLRQQSFVYNTDDHEGQVVVRDEIQALMREP